VGVVDVGSNAIRVTIAEVSSSEIRPIETHRFSLRLGKDVFNNGRTISLESQANLIDIFNQIKKIFLEHKVDLYRAVATAALRSARNRKRVLSRVLRNTGIQIELISAEEEGRLIGASLPKRHFARRELLMDLGGGSLELAYYENSVLKGVTTLPLGAVRLLSKGQSVHALCDHIAAVSEKDTFLWKFIQHTPKDLYVVGSGGNIRALYRRERKDQRNLFRFLLPKLICFLKGLKEKPRLARLLPHTKEKFLIQILPALAIHCLSRAQTPAMHSKCLVLLCLLSPNTAEI
jgi:exopolyphosphatase/guanosine-5'-triphosphate,3'-diphosphate pyrophosphatase